MVMLAATHREKVPEAVEDLETPVGGPDRHRQRQSGLSESQGRHVGSRKDAIGSSRLKARRPR